MLSQQLHNDIRDHLLTQNACAAKDNYDKQCGRTCLYLDPVTGHKCAVGGLIPEHLYEPDMENKDAENLLDDHPDLRLYLYEKYRVNTFNDQRIFCDMLADRQRIHDRKPVHEWPKALRNLALDCGLAP